ncbi:hypothetical protein AB1Y20_000698 [Prymnesium parvum]|uniref:Distal membrane arm assembly complex 2-like protein n=1 Tax=Prymnesium parvum TaxID=97485 RepID=A0AB34K8R0_PRYPA
MLRWQLRRLSTFAHGALASKLGRPLSDLQTSSQLSLRAKDLAHGTLSAGEMKLLVLLLEANPALRTLDLTGHGMGSASAADVARLLRGCHALQALHLGNNNLRAGVVEIADALQENATLLEMHLPAYSIGPDACQHIALALETNRALQTLDLSDNAFGPKGGSSLARALRTNSSVRSLHLRTASIRVQGACDMADALKKNTRLCELGLQENFMGAEGVSAMAQMLHYNSTLHSLDLSNNGISVGSSSGTASTITALAEALMTNTTLQILDLQLNGLDVDSKQELTRAAHRSNHLRLAPLQLKL